MAESKETLQKRLAVYKSFLENRKRMQKYWQKEANFWFAISMISIVMNLFLIVLILNK